MYRRVLVGEEPDHPLMGGGRKWSLHDVLRGAKLGVERVFFRLTKGS